ncbi:hypothetical protein EGW08_004602, partial [Elysia chlorotica]
MEATTATMSEQAIPRRRTSFPSAATSSAEDKILCSSLQDPIHLNPNVKEFVPRLNAKRTLNPVEPQTDKLESDKLQREPVSAVTSKKEEGKASSVAKLSEKAPFLFKMPMKPRLLRQQPGDTPTITKATTKDVETQTDSPPEQDDGKLCASCQRQRQVHDGNSQASESGVSVTGKAVSREHKIKYVACQAGMMVQESPGCLDQDDELRRKLKAKLQAMCHQFRTRVTAQSELEDATICRIAVDLLQEHPVFCQPEKNLSFLRHLSAETDIQLEIAFELMADGSETDQGKSMEKFELKDQEGSDGTKSFSTLQSETLSSSKNVEGHSVKPTQCSARLEPSLSAATAATRQEWDRDMAPSGDQARLGKVQCGTENEKLVEALAKNVNLDQGSELIPPGFDLQRCQDLTQLFKIQQSYLLDRLSQKLAGNDKLNWPETFTPEYYLLLDQINTLSGMPPVPDTVQNTAVKKVQQSNLTVANLIKHNSLINEKDKAQACMASRSDVGNEAQPASRPLHFNSATEASKSSDSIKRLPKSSSLRKLPPLNLRAAKTSTSTLSQPLSLKQEKGRPESSGITSSLDPVAYHQPSACNPQLTMESLSIPASEFRFSAPSSASFVPSTTSAPLSTQHPNAGTLSAVSKLRKYMTPLQRKRLKMKAESIGVAPPQVQNVPDSPEKPITVLVQEQLESQSVASSVDSSKAKRSKPLSIDHSGSFVGVNDPISQTDSNLPSNQLADVFSRFMSISQQANSTPLIPSSFNMATSLAHPLPSTFHFPSSFTGNQSRPVSSEAAGLDHLKQHFQTLPGINKITSTFGNQSVASASTTFARSSQGSQSQRDHSSSHPVEESNSAASSVKGVFLNHDVAS